MVLFIFVEGSDDHRFFDEIIAPELRDTYDRLVVTPYRQQSAPSTDAMLVGVLAQGNDYVFTADRCGTSSDPTPTERVVELQGVYPSLDRERITLVSRMIESWYLAGLDSSALRKMGLDPGLVPNKTDDIDKGDVDSLVNRVARYKNRADLLKEARKRYSLEVARGRNASLDAFLDEFSI